MRPHISRIIIIPLMFVLSMGVAGAEPADERELDTWVKERIDADGPGVAVIVVRDGETILSKGYGLADIENNLQVAADGVFRLGSITKQFTSAAIMMLAEEGKLAVTDPITKFLPDYPTHGHEITIHHLLTHTSGIMNYTAIPGWSEDFSRLPLTTDELINAFSAEEMNFAPGTRYSYSNSGYALLGAIVEAISGGTYEEFLETRIFEPLGLDHTYYGGHLKIIPKRVRGYSVNPDGSFANMEFIDMAAPYAAGALLSTVGDLAVWFEALSSGRVVSADSYATMTSTTTLNDGEISDYGYGLGTGELRGRSTVGHAGGISGFITYALHLPDEKVYVAVLGNVTGGTPGPGFIARSIAAMAIGDPFTSRVAIDLGAEQKALHVGTYKADNGMTFQVSLEEGRLFVGGPIGMRAISAASENLYFIEGTFWRMEFHGGEDDGPDYLNFFLSEKGEPFARAKKAEEPATSDE